MARPAMARSSAEVAEQKNRSSKAVPLIPSKEPSRMLSPIWTESFTKGCGSESSAPWR